MISGLFKKMKTARQTRTPKSSTANTDPAMTPAGSKNRIKCFVTYQHTVDTVDTKTNKQVILMMPKCTIMRKM